MDRFLRASRGADRLAIDGNLRFVLASLLEEQAARSVFTARLALPTGKKGSQNLGDFLGIQSP
jgi:hypothetical protein